MDRILRQPEAVVCLYTYKIWKTIPIAGDPDVHQSTSSIGTLRMPDVPVKLSDTPGAVRTPPPILGEHTEEVLRNILGYSNEQIGQLRAESVIL
jgi:hypothetical protein